MKKLVVLSVLALFLVACEGKKEEELSFISRPPRQSHSKPHSKPHSEPNKTRIGLRSIARLSFVRCLTQWVFQPRLRRYFLFVFPTFVGVSISVIRSLEGSSFARLGSGLASPNPVTRNVYFGSSAYLISDRLQAFARWMLISQSPTSAAGASFLRNAV